MMKIFNKLYSKVAMEDEVTRVIGQVVHPEWGQRVIVEALCPHQDVNRQHQVLTSTSHLQLQDQ